MQEEVPDDGSGNIHASATSLRHEMGRSTTLSGDVILEQNGRQLRGDRVRLDASAETYEAEGQVALRQKGLLLRGERIAGNLHRDTAVIDQASFLLHSRSLRGSSTRISRDEEGVLHIDGGEVTSCPPDDNTWSVTGQDIRLHADKGYGTARNMTLRIKNIPLAWFPYIRFPVDDRRLSGLLWPSMGHSDDGGTDIAIPLYFNLAPERDATWTLHSIRKRGLMHQGEFRFMNPYSMNSISGAFLSSDDQYRRRENGDRQDRWATQVSHKGSMGDWSSLINFSRVSDIDYLDDFDGFAAIDPNFDQSLNINQTPALQNIGWLVWQSGNWQTRLEVQGFQKLSQTLPEQYETLPKFSLSGQKQFSRFYTSGLIQATAFDKADGSGGTRLVADMAVSSPHRQGWGFVVPSLRYVHRNYHLDDTSPNTRDSANIGTALVSLDAGLKFERNLARRNRVMKQTLEPRLYYLYAEEEFQDDLPLFDTSRLTPSLAGLFRQNRYAGYDRIGDANQLALGLSSSLYRSLDGKPLVTLGMGQVFHFADRKVQGGDFSGNDPTAGTSPLFLTLTTNPGRWRLRGSYEHDTENNLANRGFLAVRYQAGNNAILNLSYSMMAATQNRNSKRNEETDVSFHWPLGRSDTWNLMGRWNHDQDSGRTLESLFGIEYNNCCWTAKVLFRRHLEEPQPFAGTSASLVKSAVDSRSSSGIYLELQLKGLASLGGRLDKLTRNSIPGFEPR